MIAYLVTVVVTAAALPCAALGLRNVVRVGVGGHACSLILGCHTLLTHDPGGGLQRDLGYFFAGLQWQSRHRCLVQVPQMATSRARSALRALWSRTAAFPGMIPRLAAA